MIIGVTGSLSCGKSTVSRYFKELNFKVIDADKIVHRILDRSTRIALRKTVIDNAKEFDSLEQAVHPIIIKQIKEKIIQARKRNHNLIIDAPLLIEVGLNKLVDFLVVVKANRYLQINRAKKSLGLTKDQAIKLIKRQMPLKEKIRKADFIIDNNGGLLNTRKQVRDVWEKMKNE